LAPAFQFYPVPRACPSCRSRLVTATPLTRTFTQGILHSLGITCYCVRCNNRYRAASSLRYAFVAWLGPVGRWLWWQTASLELTLQGDGPLESTLP